MEEFIETVFDSRFFQLPFLEALSYVTAILLVGAIIVGLTRRARWVSPHRRQSRRRTKIGHRMKKTGGNGKKRRERGSRRCLLLRASARPR